ncbi:unnamed protein product [Bursaphelenchus xylophilus]|uniref:(pine wood nematode) hypothetical protein n=1 Tax=Bursaphelenchus xylophilus TaxID=6326 RepID=A0A1I7RRY2_BURXY|nr:unnamed protein product [Bursaphelenchus xylophilus]CAG9123394.1 unnamed protein product [Bursaphelenchus xylophilus]
MSLPDDSPHTPSLFRWSPYSIKRTMFSWLLLITVVYAVQPPPSYRPFIVNNFDLNDYHSHNTILRFLNSIQNNRSRVRSLGLSSEQRHIPIVKISALDTTRPPVEVFIDAGFHAREWISVATALRLIYNLSRTNDWPSNVNIYVVPVANPDGYEYTRTFDRDWRNTRSILAPNFRNCRGVDANRNFPFHWAGQGTSNDPCSEIYHGPRPLSEPEARVVAQFLSKHANTLRAYISLHSYHNAILVPFGYRSNARPRDYDELMWTALDMTRAMNSLYGNNYTAINSAQLYPAAGCSDDYAKSLGIKYVYTMELTTGEFNRQYVGFETPRELIQQTYDEVRAALLTLLLKVSEL